MKIIVREGNRKRREELFQSAWPGGYAIGKDT